MSARGAYLIVRRGAWGARLIRIELEDGKRLAGWDVERGEPWRGSAASVLARHAAPETASAALARVRRRAEALKAGVEQADRAARKARRQADHELQREARRV